MCENRTDNLISLKRWKAAQEVEREEWSDPTHALKDYDGWMDFLKNNFGLDHHLKLFKGKVVVEIGCGPYGIIHFLNYSEGFRVGLDSMRFTRYWKTAVPPTFHIVSMGEFLPLRSETVDVIICFNVLDHVFDPQKVMNEISRVLKRNGILLLWVVTIRDLLRKLRVVLDKIDKPHPYHFTLQDVMNILQKSDLECARGMSQISHRNFQKGNKLFNFMRSLFQGRFKVAVANLCVYNTYITAKKGESKSRF